MASLLRLNFHLQFLILRRLSDLLANRCVNDTKLSKEVQVSIPYCNYCKFAECVRVGFTIWVEQLPRNRHEGEEETIYDIID